MGHSWLQVFLGHVSNDLLADVSLAAATGVTSDAHIDRYVREVLYLEFGILTLGDHAQVSLVYGVEIGVVDDDFSLDAQ